MTTGAISPVRRGQTIPLPIKMATQQTGAVAFAGSGGNKSARSANNSNGLMTCGLVIAAALAAAAYFIFGGGSKKAEESDESAPAPTA